MLATAVLTAALISPMCSWDKPGSNKYSGDVPVAVQNYSDMPTSVRNKLQKRLELRQYDDIATISRNKIQGKYEYSDLRDMHFGKNRLCTTVTREKWKDNAEELGLIYCEGEYCIIVPTVCNNVSRVTRNRPAAPPVATSTTGGGAGGGAFYASPIPPLAPIVIPDTPTFETVVKTDILPPPVIHQEGPYWFPPIAPIWSVGGDSGCCYRPRPITPPIPAVPEPSTFLLMLAGIISLLIIRVKSM